MPRHKPLFSYHLHYIESDPQYTAKEFMALTKEIQ